MKPLAIEVENFGFCYQETSEWVLEDVSFAVPYGQLVVLTGDTGCGKSTLLSAINGVIPGLLLGKSKGRILINGQQVNEWRISDRAHHIGSVLQRVDAQIIHDVVEDELAFGCENLNHKPDQIEQALNNVSQLLGLDLEAFTKELSGGQKQRLMLGAVLAMELKILVLDEPFAHLDHNSSMILVQKLKQLKHLGYAILLVEHRIKWLLDLADSHYRLELGRANLEPIGTELIQVREPRIHTTEIQLDGSPCYRLKAMGYQIQNRVIIKPIDMEIGRGERVVIVGDNGCGKTTLLRLLGRLIDPTMGTLEQFILPNQQKRPKSDWFKRVGFVYQDPSYQLFMPTVFEEVSFQGKSLESIQKALEALHLQPLVKRHPHTLSEGQKRRLTVACVIAMEPDVILLDEPTVGQDLKSLDWMMLALNRLHQEKGTTLISVTHDERCMLGLSDRILSMG